MYTTHQEDFVIIVAMADMMFQMLALPLNSHKLDHASLKKGNSGVPLSMLSTHVSGQSLVSNASERKDPPIVIEQCAGGRKRLLGVEKI